MVVEGPVAAERPVDDNEVNPMIDNETEYARHLGALEGTTFEKEVGAFLLRCYSDFQAVPAKPWGDGGLDGISHRFTRAYCCYGPEQEPFKKNIRGLKADILRKFRSDLRTLFELEMKSRRPVQSETRELATIIPDGRRIKSIFLVVSTFNDHRIIGPLNKDFAHYCEASACRYVEQNATLAIWGPEQVVAQGGVSDSTLRRIEQRALLAKAERTIDTEPSEELETEDFKGKFDWLESRFPLREAKVRSLRSEFRRHWTVALRLDQEFSNTSVSIHQSLESFRGDAILDAELRSLQSTNPIELLTGMRELITRKLRERFGTELSAEIISPLANGETARLVGECPIDWR